MALALSTRTPLESTQNSLRLTAPGRLHLGFLDPSGTLGRRFGSLGMVVEGFDTEVALCSAVVQRVSADTPEGDAQIERAAAHLHTLRTRSGRHDTLHLRLLRAAPAHAGLGSGTQLALAIGRAFARWHGLEVNSAMLAHWLGRGRRSGIGIHGFDLGGLLVDGGPRADGQPAALLSRMALPAAWRVVVVQDPRQHGLAGHAEQSAMAALPPMPAADSAEICHEVLMRVLPGAAGGDIQAFAQGVSHIQALLGAHYAPAQGGSGYTSLAVGRLMQAFARSAPEDAAIGQSSWGPTGFAIVGSQARAEVLVSAARAAGQVEPGLSVRIVAPRNQGAELTDTRMLRRLR